MGPHEPRLQAVGGVDDAVDQVKRRAAFIRRHPEISITSPRENGTSVFQAIWTTDEPPQDPGQGEGVVILATHEQLRFLLDYLEARFDR